MRYAGLLRIITPPAGALALILLLLVVESALALVQPWLAGQVTARILSPDPASVGGLLLFWLGLAVANAVIGFTSAYLVGSTSEDMSAGLRTRIYEHLQALPMRYFHDRSQGETLALLTRDADIISRFITQTIVRLLPQLATFIGAFVLMAMLDVTIALIALVLMPAYFLAMKWIGRGIRPIASDWVQSWSKMYAFAEENLGLLAAIKAFTRERLELKRFAERNQDLRLLSRRQLRVQAVLTSSVGLLASAGLLLLVWLGARQLQAGSLQAGDLVSLLLYAMLMTRPISGLAGVYGQVQQTRGAAERLLECFGEQAEPDHAPGRSLADVRGGLRFEGVSYAYPGRPPALDAIDLAIEPGETVGIVGPNGAGKSTLAWLLMRYADPDAGRILIDDTDIRDVSLNSLRSRVGIVPQHTLLLNASVRDNIAYGMHKAEPKAIEAAATAARAAPFIEDLPDGYDTLIGDQGVRLSGGQRQRLSLARTLLKDPPIIILDEATSMFDPQGEQDFLTECADLLRGRTVLMITHRPISLSIADRVIEMRDGKVLNGHRPAT